MKLPCPFTDHGLLGEALYKMDFDAEAPGVEFVPLPAIGDQLGWIVTDGERQGVTVGRDPRAPAGSRTRSVMVCWIQNPTDPPRPYIRGPYPPWHDLWVDCRIPSNQDRLARLLTSHWWPDGNPAVTEVRLDTQHLWAFGGVTLFTPPNLPKSQAVAAAAKLVLRNRLVPWAVDHTLPLYYLNTASGSLVAIKVLHDDKWYGLGHFDGSIFGRVSSESAKLDRWLNDWLEPRFPKAPDPR